MKYDKQNKSQDQTKDDQRDYYGMPYQFTPSPALMASLQHCTIA